MEQNQQELLDSKTQEGAESLDELATEDAVDSSKFQELAEKNKKLYARAKNAEEQNKIYKEQLKTKQEEKPLANAQQSKASDSTEIEQVLELQSKGYSNSEILTIRKYAKAWGKTVFEVAEDDLIKAGIEAKRAKANIVEAIPSPSSSSNSSIVVNGKTVAQMSKDERRAAFGKMKFKK